MEPCTPNFDHGNINFIEVDHYDKDNTNRFSNMNQSTEIQGRSRYTKSPKMVASFEQ